MKNISRILTNIILLLGILVGRVDADTQYADVVRMAKEGANAAFGSGRTDIFIDDANPYSDATLNARFVDIQSSMDEKSNYLNISIQRGTGSIVGVGWGGDDDVVTNIKITDISNFPPINAKKNGKKFADAADDNPSSIVWTNDRTSMVIILDADAYELPSGWKSSGGFYYQVFAWNPANTIIHLTFDLYLSGDSTKYYTGDDPGQKWHRKKLESYYNSLKKSKIDDPDWVRGIFFWTLIGNIESFLPLIDIQTIGGTATEGANDTGLIRVTRTDNAALPLSVNATWATFPANQNNVTVSMNGKTVGASFTINFTAGQTAQDLVVKALDDGIYNPGEKLIATLATSANYKIQNPSASVDIVNTTALRANIAASKPDAYLPSTPGEFKVDLSATATVPITVKYTVGGTAPANVRYQALPGSLTFQPGQKSLVIPVVPIENYVVTPTQTVIATLVAGSDYTLGSPGAATVNIIDDNDNVFSLVTDNATAVPNGAPVSFRVVRAGNNLGPITLDWSLAGTALPLANYTPQLPSSVLFGNGIREVAFTINAVPFPPPNKTVSITLIGRPRYTLGNPGNTTLTIVAKIPVTKVTINGTIFSGASTVQDAVDAWVPEGVVLKGGIIALGSGNVTPSTKPVTLTPQPEYLNGTWIPPVVPYGIDVRIKQITTDAP